MTEQQKAAVRLALPFCRDRIQIPAKGSIDYQAAAAQIAALPDSSRIRELVSWLMEYEAQEVRSKS